MNSFKNAVCSALSITMMFMTACGSNVDPRNGVPTEGASQQATPQSPSSTPSSALPESFGFRRFQSFTEAEAYVGYPLAASNRFDPLNGFFVQPEVSDSTPNPAVKVIYQLGPDQDVYVTMGPEGLWPKGVFDGERTEIAGRSAVVFERDDQFLDFAFQIGSLKGKPIWYSVQANNLDESQIDAFVRSIVVE